MSLSKLSLPGIIKLFWAGDGKIGKLFFQCIVKIYERKSSWADGMAQEGEKGEESGKGGRIKWKNERLFHTRGLRTGWKGGGG